MMKVVCNSVFVIKNHLKGFSLVELFETLRRLLQNLLKTALIGDSGKNFVWRINLLHRAFFPDWDVRLFFVL